MSFSPPSPTKYFFFKYKSTTYRWLDLPAENETSASSPTKILYREDKYVVFDKDSFKNVSLPGPFTVFGYSLAISSLLAIIGASYHHWVKR